MATTLRLRSTSTLSQYVRVTDRLATLAAEIKSLQREELALRPEVIAEIGARREVRIRDRIRILEPSETVSVRKTDLADQVIADLHRFAGLAIDTRSPEWVSPAKLRKYALEGSIPSGCATIEKTAIVIVH